MSRSIFWSLALGAVLVMTFIFMMAPYMDDPAHPSRSSVVAAETTPAPLVATPAPGEPYTFSSVLHTPEETARARLVCADMGEKGWTMAWQRQRTGMTLPENAGASGPGARRNVRTAGAEARRLPCLCRPRWHARMGARLRTAGLSTGDAGEPR